ncbi:oligopeptide-binding protein AppA precursor [bacterium BMS3Abin04]|nr:oligopeptide-binding protein AppA precursor [bacterium BMS3Abin04]
MKHKIIFSLIISVSLIFFSGCSKKTSQDNRVVIGISADIKTLDPLYTLNLNEGRISELIYLSLIGHEWDNENGNITSYPMLAKSWEWINNHKSIKIILRKNLYWSDSSKFTTKDIVFSFDAYSDPKVQSRFYGEFNNFYTDKDSHIDINKSFDVVAPDTVIINFKKNSNPTLFDIDMPILPEHYFIKLERKNYSTAEINFKTIGTGPYALKSWLKNEKIVLKKNSLSYLYSEESINRLIFKIIPNYNSRLIQLQKGEIDILDDIRSDDLDELKKANSLNVAVRKGRSYDYVGLCNIDKDLYQKNGKIVPNGLFGSFKVRKALVHAINRKLIIEEFLNNAAELAVSPVAPIFKFALNKSIQPYEFNPELSKKMLLQLGWIDSDQNGILDKNGKEFSFNLYIPSGNPRRKFTANIIKENLKNIGIEVKVQPVEPSVFFNNMFEKKYDAWIAGWAVPIPIDLKPYWNSDLKVSVANCVGYQNKDVDLLLEKIENTNDANELSTYYKKVQLLIHNDEPVVFLFWIDNITVYNKKLKNISINPLGSIQHCWEWRVDK